MSQDKPPGSTNVISLFGGAPPSIAPVAPEPAAGALNMAPDAPRTDDPRQLQSRRTLGNTSAGMGRRSAGPRPNLDTGFAAASVDLGRLQTILEDVLANLTAEAVVARWANELEDTLQAIILEWVQRVGKLELSTHESGLRVHIETQDDFGYYQYAFDVFPGKNLED